MIDLMRRFSAKPPKNHARLDSGRDGAVDAGDLDVAFYRSLYPDLADLSDQAAVDHWTKHGLVEGRVPNAVGFPADFRAYDYVAANYDLVQICADAPSAVRHYLRHGQKERRNYRMGADDPAFLEVFRSRSVIEIAVVDPRWRWMPSNAESYLRHAGGFKDIGFLREFDVPFYAAVAGLDEPASRLRASCIFHFVEQGAAALLPISPRLNFDPVFYRDRFRRTIGEGSAERTDLFLYRGWLEAGEDRAPGTLAIFTLNRFGIECTRDNIVALETYRFANKDLAGLDDEGLISHALTDGLFERRSSIRITRQNINALTLYADYLAQTGDAKAETLYRRLQHFVDDHPPLNEHFANMLFERGQYAEAIGLYRRNIAAGRAGPWSYLNAAACCDRLNDLEGSLAILIKGARAYADVLRMGHARNEAADRFFADEYALARADAMAGRIPAAHERLAAASELCTPFVESTALTRPVRTVALFANMDLSQCTLYRVEQKVEQLVAAGYEVKIYDWILDEAAFARDLSECDAVIFYRVAAFPKVIRAILAARAAGLHVFYEIDDLIFDSAEFPEGFESYTGQITWSEYVDVALGVPLFRHAMTLCDYAIASTPALARRMEPLVRQRRAFVHRNGLGRRHLAAVAAAAAQPARRRGEPVTIFYGSGTKAHKRDVEDILIPALEEIDRRFGKRVRFVIAGHPPVGLKSDLLARVDFQPFTANIEAYWALAGQADIALSVLKPTAATDAKSEIKWLEAAMFSTPAVISPTETFTEMVADGNDGLFAADTAGFVEALSRLVSDDPYREAVGAAAYRKTQAGYAPDVMSANLVAIFDAVQKPLSAAIRILVVNVFYAPQAKGGATRVVIDNIRNLRALYGDAFEFEVFTTLEGGLEPYGVTVYAHEGVRVTAMTASNRSDVDSIAIDAASGEIFRRCVERFAPNLVHFHCIQCITAAATEVVRAMGVPYVITAHDGWWICDRQFLHDANGLVEPYDFETPHRFRPRIAGVDFARPSALLPSLRGAAAILAVSEPFAAVYRATGLDNVRTLANGLPDGILYAAEHHPRAPSIGGKVRIGHVGGLEAHKGFPLLRRAIEVARPRHISLLAVDLAMATGEVREEVWGEVEVRFVARRPQAAVMSLYDDIDVLFAPSLWPESFGLVTREALAAGCWVVASDRGAIGEPVEDGVDGHIVSVDDLSGLTAVLRTIDADPARYTTPPPRTRTPRTSSDQARELGALYQELTKCNFAPEDQSS